MNNVDLASYTDENTPYIIRNGVKELINSTGFETIKSSFDKCYFLTSCSDKVSIFVDNYNI